MTVWQWISINEYKNSGAEKKNSVIVDFLNYTFSLCSIAKLLSMNSVCVFMFIPDGLFGQCRSSKQDQVQYQVSVPVLKRMQEVLKQLMLQGEIKWIS